MKVLINTLGKLIKVRYKILKYRKRLTNQWNYIILDKTVKFIDKLRRMGERDNTKQIKNTEIGNKNA